MFIVAADDSTILKYLELMQKGALFNDDCTRIKPGETVQLKIEISHQDESAVWSGLKDYSITSFGPIEIQDKLYSGFLLDLEGTIDKLLTPIEYNERQHSYLKDVPVYRSAFDLFRLLKQKFPETSVNNLEPYKHKEHDCLLGPKLIQEPRHTALLLDQVVEMIQGLNALNAMTDSNGP